MPLADMLSAMRGVILDGILLPDSSEERERTLQKHFPGLSTLEARDLALIEPEKLQIYTGTIFRGEAGLLQRLFPMTFASLQESWSSCFNEPLNPFRFTQSLHKARPWKNNATVGLAASFVAYVCHDLPAVSRAVPAISEISNFELASLRVLRAIRGPSQSALDLSAIQSRTVEQLLGLALSKSAPTEALSLEFNVLEARDYFRMHGSLVGFTFVAKPRYLAGSRDADNDLYWTEIPQPIFKLLSNSLAGSANATVEDFAAACLENSESQSEEEKFKEFFELFSTLLVRGALIASEAE